MALRFRKSMFWCWTGDGQTYAMIGLSPAVEKRTYEFRDRLASDIASRMGLALHEEHGTPTAVDSYLGLYDKGDAEQVERFFARRVPDLLERALKTASYRAWEKEWALVRSLLKMEIETNHDFYGILVYSSAVRPDEVRTVIGEVAQELGLEMNENPALQGVSIYSNTILDSDDAQKV